MITIDTTLRRALEVSGRDLILTLDPALQGLPETAHGGSVLAVFDALAEAAAPREVSGTYHRRVPLGVPLAPQQAREGAPASRLPLPVSRTCFACGTDNDLGLRARLGFDDDTVGATWEPRPPFRRADGTLAPAALTTLLDEAAFWLGALATGESGMTTELRVSLHHPAPFEAPVTVSGARAGVRPRPDDARYQDTEIVARAGGQVVATARITFVAVRGAARRLVSGMLAINDPESVRRVFPAYTR